MRQIALMYSNLLEDLPVVLPKETIGVSTFTINIRSERLIGMSSGPTWKQMV